ncbi:unnamed protein product [Ophioblennius macclurei]
MKRSFLVEPVVALYAFSCFLFFPVQQQFVYRRLWEQLTNTSYPITENSSSCASNGSSNHSKDFEEVQRQASYFSLYSELLSLIPSLIVTILLVTYSDRAGRKMAIIPPLFGTLLYILTYLIVSYFELDVYILIGASLLSSLFGGFGTFLGGIFAYIADLCETDRERTLRMTGVEMIIGLFSGGAAISTGYFLAATGFNYPFITSALCLCLNILYAIFFLEESRPRDSRVLEESSEHSALMQAVCGFYFLLSEASCKGKAVLILMILIFTTLSFANSGGLSMVTLYELNEPLCWSEILIGYGVALSTTVFLASYVGVRAFTHCGVSPLVIILLGILSVMAGMVMSAFAKTTLMMFLVRVPLLLSVMPFPVLRSMMSKIVSSSQQGALFACVSFMQSLTSNISSAIFSYVYAHTVAWYSGFSFLLGAILCLVPLGLLGALAFIGVDVPETKQNQEEANPVEGEDGTSEHSPLLG